MEAKSLEDLGALLGKEGVSFVDLTREIECGNADGYLYQTGCPAETFVGVQVSFANRSRGEFTIAKSTSDIVESVIDHEFIFVGMFYDESVLSGALLLTPDDYDTIQSLPPSAGVVLPSQQIQFSNRPSCLRGGTAEESGKLSKMKRTIFISECECLKLPGCRSWSQLCTRIVNLFVLPLRRRVQI